MQAILQFALRSLLARPGRSALLASAVAFATALLTAMACGIATAETNVHARIDRLIGSIDARIIHEFSQSFEETVVDDVRSWPDVDAVTARLFGSLTLVRADGRPGAGGRPLRTTVQARGIDAGADPRLLSITLLEGRIPAAPNEVLIDPPTQRALEVGIGDTLEVQRLGDPIELVVVGIDDRPGLGALQRPQVQLDRRTLAEAVDHPGEVNLVAIILKKGVDVAAWCSANAGRIRAPLVLEPAERVKTGLDREVKGAALAFTLVCMIGLLSCAFIVGTGLTTALSEQVRELAMLRAIGADRGQLVISQLAAGAMIAGAGATVGVPLGIGLTAIGTVIWRAHLPAGLDVPPVALLIAFAGAVGSGVIGAAFAAFAAARVTPLEALRVRSRTLRPGAVWKCGAVGVLLLAGLLAIFAIPDRDQRFWTYVLVGIPAEHVGWFLLCVPLLRCVTPISGPPLERLLRLPRGGITGPVAAHPFRLGLTAGALMVGMSILVSVWSNGLGLMASVVERVRFADAFIFKTTGLTPNEQERLRSIPGVEQAVPIGYLPVKVIGQQVFGAKGLGPANVVCVGFEPEAFLRLNRLEWVEGTPAAAIPKLKSGDAVLVAKEFLTARGLSLGDRITLGGARRSHAFEIAGVVSSAGLDVVTQFFGIRTMYMEQAVSCVFMDFDAVARWFDSHDAFIMQIDLGRDATDAQELAISEAVKAEVPGAIFSSGRAIKNAVIQIGGTVLAVSSAVAFAALVLASFGVGNVVAAGIAARRREFGVVRAIGGSRRGLAAQVLGEVALVALTAVIAGTVLGLQLAHIGKRIYRDMVGIEFDVILPVVPMLVGYVVLFALVLAAAALPLRSAARRTPRELLG